MNIGFGPREIQGETPRCREHQTPFADFDDIVQKCTKEGCERIRVRNDLQPTPSWWNVCQQCNRTYPTLEPGICTICDETMQQRWDQIIAELGR